METQWTRPYNPGKGRWLVLGWEFASLAFLAWTTVELFDLGPGGVDATAVTLAVVWLLGAWRISDMGVYVSPRGVQVRGLIRSRTVAWVDIDSFHLHEASHKLGRLRVPSGLTVLIERRDGGFVNTELWAQGVDFHARPGLFTKVFHDLRARHLAAVRGTA